MPLPAVLDIRCLRLMILRSCLLVCKRSYRDNQVQRIALESYYSFVSRRDEQGLACREGSRVFVGSLNVAAAGKENQRLHLARRQQRLAVFELVAFVYCEVLAMSQTPDRGHGKLIGGRIKVDTLNGLVNMQLSWFAGFINSIKVEDAIGSIRWRLNFCNQKAGPD